MSNQVILNAIHFLNSLDLKRKYEWYKIFAFFTQVSDKIVFHKTYNKQRFLPSEFGTNVKHDHAVGPAKRSSGVKAQLRQIIKDEGIPYTFVVCNFFAGFLLPTIGQAQLSGLPIDKYTILGDGKTKGSHSWCESLYFDSNFQE